MANATHAVANVDDYSGSARLLAATTLRQHKFIIWWFWFHVYVDDDSWNIKNEYMRVAEMFWERWLLERFSPRERELQTRCRWRCCRIFKCPTWPSFTLPPLASQQDDSEVEDCISCQRSKSWSLGRVLHVTCCCCSGCLSATDIFHSGSQAHYR